MMTRRRVNRLLAVLLSAFVLAVPLTLTPQPNAAQAASTTTLGDYAGAIVKPADSDGVRHNDIPATIARLQAAKVNTYSYMIYGYGVNNSKVDQASRDVAAGKVTQALWNELPAFASAAAAAGIKVWVYLVPPSESFAGGPSVPVASRTSTYLPFNWDYKRWASEIGLVAKAHPNITAIAIDDFGGNTAEWPSQYSFKFTPTYVGEMRALARASAPWLQVVPVLYYLQYVNMTSVATSYRPYVDGYIYPYNGVTTATGGNTTNYADAEYFTTVLSGMVKCHAGNGCLQLSVPGKTRTTTGGYGSVEQVVAVTPATTHKLTFRANDTWVQASGLGYHVMQVLVDGAVVWSQDVANWHGWGTYTVDLSARLQGKTSARLTLRVYEKTGVGNFPVAAWFDSLESATLKINNPGFEGSINGWTRLESSGPQSDQTWAPSLKFWLMPYASKLGGEPNQPTATYVSTVTSAGLRLARSGLTDGTMVYVLPLSDRTDVFNGVASLYAAQP